MFCFLKYEQLWKNRLFGKSIKNILKEYSCTLQDRDLLREIRITIVKLIFVFETLIFLFTVVTIIIMVYS